MTRYNLDSTDTSTITGGSSTPLSLSKWISVQSGSTYTDAPSMLSAKFGDAYGQFAPDGINNAPIKWTLVFVPLNAADWANMKLLYAAVGCFDWFWGTMPGDTVAMKWRIDKGSWNPSPINQTLWNVTFNVMQAFDGGS